jgi:SAM-dependent methyltransferase
MQLRRPLPRDDRRTAEQVWEHFQVEQVLADRLRKASRQERRHLYTDVYDELYRRIPFHPQLTRKVTLEQRQRSIAEQLQLLDRFLTPNTVFLEIGAGDCALSFAISARVKKVYAVDVSNCITAATHVPPNFELKISDGTSMPIPPGEVTLAFSNQLMEHLHPDDALDQLNNIYAALAPGGKYVCITPNRLTGPHDVSVHFLREARGFHLKEYTATELDRLFRKAGFRHTTHYRRLRGMHTRMPNAVVKSLESLVSALPPGAIDRVATNNPMRALLEIRAVATK